MEAYIEDGIHFYILSILLFALLCHILQFSSTFFGYVMYVFVYLLNCNIRWEFEMHCVLAIVESSSNWRIWNKCPGACSLGSWKSDTSKEKKIEK